MIDSGELYRLDPGTAGTFDLRQLHCFKFPAGAHCLRITGADRDAVKQRCLVMNRCLFRSAAEGKFVLLIRSEAQFCACQYQAITLDSRGAASG